MIYTFIAIRCRINYRDELSIFTKLRECFQASLGKATDKPWGRPESMSFISFYMVPAWHIRFPSKCNYHTLVFVPSNLLLSCNLGALFHSGLDLDPIQDFLSSFSTCGTTFPSALDLSEPWITTCPQSQSPTQDSKIP